MDLIKELLLDFTKYLDLWNRCLNISIKIRIHAKEGNLDRLNLESENRQRLLNILKYHKEKILTKLDQNDRLNEPEFLKDFFQKVQRAAFETSSLIQTIDSETLDFLSLEKIKTSSTISKISKLKTYLEN